MEAFKIKNGLQAGRFLGSNGVETAGSVGYNLAGASYDSVSFSVNAQDPNSTAVRFSADGSRMFMAGYSLDKVHQYNLSTNFDLSTASYSGTSYSVVAQAPSAYGLEFNLDGTKMYVLDYPTAVYQYSLSTAFDLSSVSYDSKSLTLSSTDSQPIHFVFNNDGTKLYMLGITTDSVFQFSLGTAYDVSTGSYDSVSFSVASQQTNGRGLAFNADGTQMYIIGFSSYVYIYNLPTGFDISTASYSGTSLNVFSQAPEPHDLTFNSDGTKMYVVGTGNDTIHQYSTVLLTQTLDLSTGTTFSFTPSGATTVSFTNPPATGNAIGFSVEVIGDGSAITWPTSVKWHEATAPTATASKELYTFVTTDGGTTYYGRKAAEDIA